MNNNNDFLGDMELNTFDVYRRRNRETKKIEVLVLVDVHIPFHVLSPRLPGGDAYIILHRKDLKRYNETSQAVLNVLRGCDLFQSRFDFLPQRVETRDPQAIPVVFPSDLTLWEQADWTCVSVIPSYPNDPSGLSGWDFYETAWLLHKWESALSYFDEDVLYLCTPVYPMDLYNQKVHPSLVLKEVNRYIARHGQDEFQRLFFALSVLTRDDLGRAFLRFFYDYDATRWTSWDVLERLYTIYICVPDDHAYKSYIFDKNFCLLKIHKQIVFKPFMLIYHLISFYGMFVSQDYYTLFEKTIQEGIHLHAKSLQLHSCKSILDKTQYHNVIRQEFALLYSTSHMALHWIGREHITRYLPTSDFWKTIAKNWTTMPRRNIFLLENSSFRYAETQLCYGDRIHFSKLFTRKNLSPRQQKLFDFIFENKK